MSGLLISLDGIDGCGKSTQLALLRDWLGELGHDVRLVRDPGGTDLGEALREILLHRDEIALDSTAEMLLYMASRAELVAEVIQPALDSGATVLSDRYLLANVVYQGYGGRVSPEEIWQVGRIATRRVMPDMTIVLDLSPETARQRLSGQPDRLESRGLDYMRKVRNGYLSEVRKLSPKAAVVDAERSVAAISAELKSVLEPLLLK